MIMKKELICACGRVAQEISWNFPEAVEDGDNFESSSTSRAAKIEKKLENFVRNDR